MIREPFDSDHDASGIAGGAMSSKPEDCPLAKALEAIGELPTFEVLHELFDGHTRFEQMLRYLKVSETVLAQRLARLVEVGLVDRFPGQVDAPGTTYALAPAGRNLRPVLLALVAWGNQYLLAEQRSMVLVDRDTGELLEPVVVDQGTGRRVDAQNCVFVAGPAAGSAMRGRYPQPLEAGRRR